MSSETQTDGVPLDVNHFDDVCYLATHLGMCMFGETLFRSVEKIMLPVAPPLKRSSATSLGGRIQSLLLLTDSAGFLNQREDLLLDGHLQKDTSPSKHSAAYVARFWQLHEELLYMLFCTHNSLVREAWYFAYAGRSRVPSAIPTAPPGSLCGSCSDLSNYNDLAPVPNGLSRGDHHHLTKTYMSSVKGFLMSSVPPPSSGIRDIPFCWEEQHIHPFQWYTMLEDMEQPLSVGATFVYTDAIYDWLYKNRAHRRRARRVSPHITGALHDTKVCLSLINVHRKDTTPDAADPEQYRYWRFRVPYSLPKGDTCPPFAEWLRILCRADDIAGLFFYALAERVAETQQSLAPSDDMPLLDDADTAHHWWLSHAEYAARLYDTSAYHDLIPQGLYEVAILTAKRWRRVYLETIQRYCRLHNFAVRDIPACPRIVDPFPSFSDDEGLDRVPAKSAEDEDDVELEGSHAVAKRKLAQEEDQRIIKASSVSEAEEDEETELPTLLPPAVGAALEGFFTLLSTVDAPAVRGGGDHHRRRHHHHHHHQQRGGSLSPDEVVLVPS